MRRMLKDGEVTSIITRATEQQGTPDRKADLRLSAAAETASSVLTGVGARKEVRLCTAVSA